MRIIRSRLLGFGLLAATACGESAATGNTQGGLQASKAEVDDADGSGLPAEAARGNGAGKGEAAQRAEADAGIQRVADAGAPPVSLLCARGGDSAPVSVVFGCDRVTVVTCKDLSNVVIELVDGSRQRVEGLDGHQNVFVASGGRAIAGVWVKAGANHSGDGPGYGERFDAPAASCADAGTPPQNPPGQPPPGDACVPAPDQPCGTFNPPRNPPPPPPADGPGRVD